MIWQLSHDLHYTAPDGREFVVPAGYRSDAATIPRFLWPFFPALGRYARAAFLHDYMIETKSHTRREIDDIFYDALRACNTTRVVAFWMWAAVRAYAFVTRAD